MLEPWATKKNDTAAPRRPMMQAALQSTHQAGEIARLQRENERLRMKCEILKRSVEIFAKPLT